MRIQTAPAKNTIPLAHEAACFPCLSARFLAFEISLMEPRELSALEHFCYNFPIKYRNL